MKAVIYDAFGPAEQALHLVDMEKPTPAQGEVLVKLAYSGVNPSDVKARAGTRPGVVKPPFPQIIPHSDGAGEVVSVGEGVPDTRIGQSVWIWNAQWQRAFGTCAEYVALPAEQAVPMPQGVDLQVGAVLGIPGLTACYTVFNGGSVKGKTVLVQGAAGTVGYLAVQLALWGGARVIATARGAGADRVRALGVEHVIDFTQPDIVEQVLDANEGNMVDHIIDPEFGANIDINAQLIAPNGLICAYGSVIETEPTLPFMPMMFKAITLDFALIYILTDTQRNNTISMLTRALEDGAVSFPVDQVFSLEDTAEAHKAVEAGQRDGAILIKTHVGPE